ncbi:MAG: 3-hydroxyacyl-ACP dehydratase FabZ [Caldisericia bacterium]|nr:3-hydroxyacyl-ACP dehydratase FabZ [Caldisericia bacterium]
MELSNIEIRKIIPHRFPFMLIDKVLDVEPGKYCVAIKNVTTNEPQFTGHFPDQPIMPGVLVVEALAQAGAVCALSMPENKDKLALFVGIDGFRFKRQVVPGDQIRLEVNIESIKMGIFKCFGRATVENEIVAEGRLMAAVRMVES